MKAARTVDAGRRTGGLGLFYRSPAAAGNQEDRAVLRRGRGDRRVLIEDLEAVQLDDVLVGVTHVGVQLLERQFLEAAHRRQRIGIDSNGVPGFQNLCSEIERVSTAGSKLQGLTLNAEAADEWHQAHSPLSVATASGTGASVAKKRATC